MADSVPWHRHKDSLNRYSTIWSASDDLQRPRPWDYHALPAALGCRGWFTARVTTLGELDAALDRAAAGESASYIEVVGDRLDFPPGLAKAHQHLDALYGKDSASGNDAGPSGRAPSPFRFQNQSTYHRLEGPDGR